MELRWELNARCSASSAKQQGPTSGFRCNVLIYIYFLRVHIDIQSLQVIYVYKVVARIYTLMFIATEKGYSSGLMIHFWMNR